MNNKSNLGLIGLAVMGENLALNFESRGYKVSVYNRTNQKVTEFINGRGANKNFYGASSLEDFCNSLQVPRKIMLMVKAGEAVDKTIESLLPFLKQGDIIIDGGNTNFPDTVRREKYLAEKQILFIGSGVSGGEEGALHGPSLMPGGNKAAWSEIKPYFEAISAKVNGEACSSWIGEGGAGHFVKMVHNGIEYGDMQVIAEGYDIARKLLKLNNLETSELFDKWNNGRLSSYLIEITAKVLKVKEGDKYLVDLILDTAGQKGTGKWTAISAIEEAIPLNLITDAVFARYISSQKELREKMSELYPNDSSSDLIKIDFNDLEGAIYASKLISYAQGFEFITTKSAQENWNINPGEVAKIWRGGCIIRSAFLDDITKAYNGAALENLLLSPFYKATLPSVIESLRKVVAAAALNGIGLPCMNGALSYYSSITSKKLPANIIQAQRDFFGAHTYERVDKPRGEFFHNVWE